MRYYIILFFNLSALVLIPLLMLHFHKETINFLSVRLSNTSLNISATEIPRNCEIIPKTMKHEFATSGVYQIYIVADNKIQAKNVYCDMNTDNGGLTVIQRRSENDSQTDFYRTWNQYVKGFGDLENSFWLGLDTISAMTNSDIYELRIDMMDMDGEKRYAKYDIFRVSNATDLYRLYIQGYTGDAGDSLSGQSGMPFSTKDRDNDANNGSSCANLYHGAWWYNNCHASNLNGLYGSVDYARGVVWHSWKGHHHSLKRVEMKIRTVNFDTNH